LVVSGIADNATFKQAEYNSAFVLTEYFSYLRRDAGTQVMKVGFTTTTSHSHSSRNGSVAPLGKRLKTPRVTTSGAA